MVIHRDKGLSHPTIDKRRLCQSTDALNVKMGFVRDPSVTAEQVQKLMREDGIRPEENLFSRGLIRMRDGIEE